MYKYTGDSAYLSGVPARDLTDEEFDTLPKMTQEACLATGLYIATSGKSTPVAEKTKKESTNG